jgi:hypothetical protein
LKIDGRCIGVAGRRCSRRVRTIGREKEKSEFDETSGMKKQSWETAVALG